MRKGLHNWCSVWKWEVWSAAAEVAWNLPACKYCFLCSVSEGHKQLMWGRGGIHPINLKSQRQKFCCPTAATNLYRPLSFKSVRCPAAVSLGRLRGVPVWVVWCFSHCHIIQALDRQCPSRRPVEPLGKPSSWQHGWAFAEYSLGCGPSRASQERRPQASFPLACSTFKASSCRRVPYPPGDG